MVDNVAVTPGTGATIATDDVSGIQFQKVKVDAGGDGLTVPIIAGAQVAAASLPVVVASDQAAIAVKAASGALASGAVAAGAVAAGAYVSGSILSGALADGADVTFGAKADAKNSATDATAITAMQVLKQISASVQAPPSQAVTNAGTFAVQATQAGTWNVTVNAALPAGTNLLGKVGIDQTTPGTTNGVQVNAALPAGANTVGKVDILGNGGATLDAVVGAATAPTNMLAVGGVYNSTDLAPTNGQSAALQLDSHAHLKARAEGRLFYAAFGTLTRPANTTAYTANDAVSNNATAASVTAQTATIADLNDDPFAIESMIVTSTDTGVAGKSFRAWLYRADPTASTGIVGGDNVAFSTKRGSFIGTMSGTFKTFSDGSVALLAPDDVVRLITTPVSGAQTLYILWQTLDAFTPSATSTTFIATIAGYQGRV